MSALELILLTAVLTLLFVSYLLIKILAELRAARYLLHIMAHWTTDAAVEYIRERTGEDIPPGPTAPPNV